jgi:hypothetical protein
VVYKHHPSLIFYKGERKRMKIAIGFEIHDSEETPILIQFSAQDRLDIIGMPPSKNVLILAPNGMANDNIDKWAQDIMTRIDPKAVYKKEKL